MNSVPCFAVIGHPNEGKSSVVATLVENDRIRISPRPGETVASQSYPVRIDGQEVIIFVDTPGFQNPLQTLGWMRRFSGSGETLVSAFLREFKNDPGMAHECELLSPIQAGAGIIYVVDASRPLRQVDKAEMEILRLTGRPRMAILNCKTGEEGFLEEWKGELRQHFNVVRLFNAIRATFHERMRLLESVRALEQDWEEPLQRVVEAFVGDWQRRNAECAALVCGFLRDALSHSETAEYADSRNQDQLEQRLGQRVEDYIRAGESRLHEAVCQLFRHDRRSFALPEHSLLRQDLFSRATWSVFGLSKRKLVAAAVAAGGAAGVALDLATLGHSLGLFATVGGAAAGLTALLQGERLVRGRMLGVSIGQRRLQVGPLHSVQGMYVMLDRFLLHYWHVVHWSHALRSQDSQFLSKAGEGKLGLSNGWSRKDRNICAEYFKAQTAGDEPRALALEQEFRVFLSMELERVAKLSSILE